MRYWQGKLFEGFLRLDLEQNRSIEGTGLGLAITHSLVEQMNGRMEVSSEYGKGSVFTVYLMQEILDDRPVGDFRQSAENMADQKGEYKESFTAPDAKVLVVDDNEMNLAVVKALLKKTDIQVTTCMSGTECLTIVSREYFDVILLDHMMPEMDGIETLGRLKQSDNKCKSTPVIALTANAIVGAKEEYLKAGFADYLAKPIEGAELENMLLQYIPRDKVRLSQEEPRQDGDNNGLEILCEGFLINTEKGIQYCTGSREFYREMLELFCSGCDDRASDISGALKAEDWKKYTVFVHGLKSTSLNIGGVQLSEAAKDLERAGKVILESDQADEEKEYIKKQHENVMNLYKATVLEARKILAEE